MSVVPVVLPRVTVTVDENGRAQISVDGIEHTDGPVDRAQLGGMLARVAEVADGPVRVEVREADGTRYADILTPRPHPGTPGERLAAERHVGVPALRAGGFAPGETVLVAVLATSIRANADGTASLLAAPAMPRRVDELILFGLTSRKTVRGSRTDRPRPRRWWQR